MIILYIKSNNDNNFDLIKKIYEFFNSKNNLKKNQQEEFNKIFAQKELEEISFMIKKSKLYLRDKLKSIQMTFVDLLGSNPPLRLSEEQKEFLKGYSNYELSQTITLEQIEELRNSGKNIKNYIHHLI